VGVGSFPQRYRPLVAIFGQERVGTPRSRYRESTGVVVPLMLELLRLPPEFAELHTLQLRGWDGAVDDVSFARLCLTLADRLGTRNDRAARVAERARRELDELRRGASRWSDLGAPVGTREEIPWPYWMIRYIVADTIEAVADLFWSIGGSPPYGGISYEEAEAVYALLNQFTGPGRASEAAYAAVEKFLTGRAEASRALEAFRIFDRVASNPEEYTDIGLRIGGVEAVEAVDEPLSSYFDFLLAGLRHKQGDLREAYRLSQRSIDSLYKHYEADAVYTAWSRRSKTPARLHCSAETSLRHADARRFWKSSARSTPLNRIKSCCRHAQSFPTISTNWFIRTRSTTGRSSCSMGR